MAKTNSLTILQINDTHGYLAEHAELFRDGAGVRHETLGGYARIKGYLEAVRAERGADAVLALDNGDTFHGTFPAVQTKGQALVAPVNRLGLDAWTVHWDAVWGPGHMREIAGQLDHPLLALNCYREGTGERPYPASAMFECGGVRVGVVGVAATIIDEAFPERVSGDLYYTLGKDELPGEIRRLREEEHVGLIVVLSHLGFPQDCQLAEDVDGIDVLLSGHTHNRTWRPATVNGTTIIQSGCHGSFVGRLDLEVTGNGASVGVTRHALVPMDASVEPDPEMQALVDEIYAPHRERLGEVVGRTETVLHRYATLEAPMDNLLLDAISEAAGRRVAFSNGWRYGAPVPIGEVTVNDLWNIIPTNPPVSVCELTGAELWDMMEANLQNTFARNPYEQKGGYVKRCRGVNIYAKIENPAGERIQELFVAGERLDRGRTYEVAFVTEQGVPRAYGQNRRDLEVSAIDALRAYFRRHGSVRADLRGTVVAA